MRVTIRGGDLDAIDGIGKSMNHVRAGVYQGIRMSGDGFSCDVCDGESWDQHTKAIGLFAREFALPLRRLVETGASVTFDVAIEPEDRDPRPFLALHADPSLLAVLAEGSLALEISIYS